MEVSVTEMEVIAPKADSILPVPESIQSPVLASVPVPESIQPVLASSEIENINQAINEISNTATASDEVQNVLESNCDVVAHSPGQVNIEISIAEEESNTSDINEKTVNQTENAGVNKTNDTVECMIESNSAVESNMLMNEAKQADTSIEITDNVSCKFYICITIEH